MIDIVDHQQMSSTTPDGLLDAGSSMPGHTEAAAMQAHDARMSKNLQDQLQSQFEDNEESHQEKTDYHEHAASYDSELEAEVPMQDQERDGPVNISLQNRTMNFQMQPRPSAMMHHPVIRNNMRESQNQSRKGISTAPKGFKRGMVPPMPQIAQARMPMGYVQKPQGQMSKKEKNLLNYINKKMKLGEQNGLLQSMQMQSQ